MSSPLPQTHPVGTGSRPSGQQPGSSGAANGGRSVSLSIPPAQPRSRKSRVNALDNGGASLTSCTANLLNTIVGTGMVGEHSRSRSTSCIPISLTEPHIVCFRSSAGSLRIHRMVSWCLADCPVWVHWSLGIISTHKVCQQAWR